MNVHLVSNLFVSAILLAVFPGCNDDTGPCVHLTYEPVFTVVAVTDGVTGAAIGTVRLSGIEVPASSGLPSYLFEDETYVKQGTNITVTGDTIGTVPFGFGVDEGTYRMTISAPGYQAKPIAFDASFAGGEGGCPSYVDDGTEVRVELMPE